MHELYIEKKSTTTATLWGKQTGKLSIVSVKGYDIKCIIRILRSGSLKKNNEVNAILFKQLPYFTVGVTG